MKQLYNTVNEEKVVKTLTTSLYIFHSVENCYAMHSFSPSLQVQHGVDVYCYGNRQVEIDIIIQKASVFIMHISITLQSLRTH